ncbi:hypothetical protein [Segetibacter koreensis]|uniref:hypothetical protein n=1 Tax=Segetibacter koreensis TaxID=398037 RepID=UPI00036E5699|nr:hypothetical protein [Segetibacter koreensis]
MIELPGNIKNSSILTSDMLELLSGIEELPVVDPSFDDNTLKNIFQYYSLTPEEMEIELHRYAAELLKQRKVYEAWQVLLSL